MLYDFPEAVADAGVSIDTALTHLELEPRLDDWIQMKRQYVKYNQGLNDNAPSRGYITTISDTPAMAPEQFSQLARVKACYWYKCVPAMRL